MLVLSRKLGESIVFPGTETRVYVSEVRSGGVVRLGIDGPASVVCVRDEVLVDESQHGIFLKARELVHTLGGKLNSTSIGLGLLKKQIEGGRSTAEIMETIERMARGLAVGEEEGSSRNFLNKSHVLLVEDDENERELLGGLLRMNSFDVEMAANGPEAMHRLDMSIRPDVILLDINLGGGMNGCEVAEQIRRNKTLDGVKIVVVTGTEVPARVPNVDRWVTKPIRPERLVWEIEQLLAVA